MKKLFIWIVFTGLACQIFANSTSLTKAQSTFIHSRAVQGDPVLKAESQKLQNLSSSEIAKQIKLMKNQLNAKQVFTNQSTVSADSKVLQSKASAITQSKLYKGIGPKQSKNWIAKALEKLFKRQPVPSFHPMVPPAGLNFLTILFWGLIGLVVLALLGAGIYFVTRFRRRKKARTLLVEDEEMATTFDEWIEAARKYANAGDWRRAIRCAYISGLLQFDMASVARFDRSQTNWQHLARINRSPKRPPNLSYDNETKTFDEAWYGHKPVSEFQYLALLNGVMQIKAQLEKDSKPGRAVTIGTKTEEEITP